MNSVAINLAVILAFKIIVGSITESLIPWVSSLLITFILSRILAYIPCFPLLTQIRYKNSLAHDESSTSSTEDVSPAEKEFLREEYSSLDLVDDYLDIAVGFGFMTMFTSALPGAVLVMLVSRHPFFVSLSSMTHCLTVDVFCVSQLHLWLQIKVDAWRLISVTRRPWPAGAEDIGTMQGVYEIVALSAVITNGAMIVFTMNVLPVHYTEYTRIWIFIGFFWVVIGIQFAIRRSIPDVPYEVEVQHQRQEYINRMIITREKVESIDELLANFHREQGGKVVAPLNVESLDIKGLVKPGYR